MAPKKEKKKIVTKGHLVVLHGDEMAQVAFEQILERFIRKRVRITLHEFDLSAKNRLQTNGDVVSKSIKALLAHGVGVKNAGVTLNEAQLDTLIQALKKENINIDKKTLSKLATKSPNSTVRKGIGGNITREDIPFTNIERHIPDWKNRDIEVVTMESGGILDSFNCVSQFSGNLVLSFVNEEGKTELWHTRPIKKGDPYLLATNNIKKVKHWARHFFQRALDEKRPAYVGLKDTVMPGYDGVMRKAVETIFHEEFEAKFKRKKLTYEYGLIDAQAAKIVAHPPKKALWGIPDNTSGRKLLKLVNALKTYGIPQRKSQVAISRMSAGGGDQYGSFNQEAPSRGIITLMMGQRIIHSREVEKGDPVMLMSNDPVAIKAWIHQCFWEAKQKDQEIYFGLKREYMPYDQLFSDIINEVWDELAEAKKEVPPVMVMTPSKQLCKMIVDPPRNARYASLNMDGDIFSDITAALGGSLATASSIIASPTHGVMLFEAPHGTAPDLYKLYLKSKGEQTLFNPSALIYAFANALEVIADRDKHKGLKAYSEALKKALIATVEEGIITADIKGCTSNPKKEKIVDLPGFLDAVEGRVG